MSSSPQTSEVPAVPPISLNPTTRDDEPTNSSSESMALSANQARQVVRLIQCPICSLPFLTDPFTLPCGRSLCKDCLPSPRLRPNVTYPSTSNRLQAVQCPFPDCTKEHAVGDCNPDVSLSKALDAAKAELVKGREAALAAGVTTRLTAKDEWEEAGIPSLRDTETLCKQLEGGNLVATFTLAENGELKHNAEVTYAKSSNETQKVSDSTTLARLKEAVRPEMECQVCYALFYEPVTTSCGHTFCRSCLQRVLDHAKFCPVCRSSLSIEPLAYRDASPTNKLMDKIITTFWPDLLEDRRQIVIAEGLENGNSGYDISIFVCTLSFPTMPTFLHVFEPRYRHMIRRALEGNRTFGMVLYNGEGFKELGTILRIVNVEFLPDGRSVLETVGVSRFKIVQHSTLDGYIVANIERINDISLAEEEELEAAETSQRPRTADWSWSPRGSPNTGSSPTGEKSLMNRSELDTTSTSELMAFCNDFVRRMQTRSVGWLATRILVIYGECPNDPALFPWWFANILPVNVREKYRLLGTTSVRERLKICCGWIFEWERSVW